MRNSARAASAGLVLLLAACGGGGAGAAQSSADQVTKAVYNDDYAAVTQNFDAPLKTHVTRSQVGTFSDAMHKLGSYDGLTYLSADPTKNEYTYRANFTNGTMNVVLRLDANGAIAGYRAYPE